MGEYKIILSVEEEKALLTDMISIFEWIENAIKNKSRQTIDKIVELSGRGSKFTSVEQKIQIIKDLINENSDLLKSAEEKNIESLI